MITLHGSLTSKIDRLDPRYIALADASLRLAKKDAHLWGPSAATEAAIRLNWIDFPDTSRALLPELDALSARFRNHREIVLCGMGGSSLAPEVIATAFAKKLFVLDSTDPNYLARAYARDLSSTVVVVSSKSGSTIETSSQRALFEERFTSAGLNPTDHMVIVTDPDSPLDQDARQRGFTVVNADPHVGGRYSALSAFGLVPAALIGVDVSVLLDSASEAMRSFQGTQSPAIAAAYLLAYHADQFLAFNDADSDIPGLSDWIEQLIAESTGKALQGRLPIVIESSLSPIGGDCIRIAFAGSSDLVVNSDLGGHFIFWEWVTALMGYALQIDPFNQPNVTEAKEQTSALLNTWAGKLPSFTPHRVDGAIEIFADADTTQEALTQVIDAVAKDGYIAIMAYLDRQAEVELAQLRRVIADKSGRPVTFGWGPRFLHSTGQFHKGGPRNGVFLQITGDSAADIAIPGQAFTFHTLIMAQALGDAEALASRKLTVLRLHLKNRSAGVAEILSAARSII
jgi:glucose-6-phosphate isomerase